MTVSVNGSIHPKNFDDRQMEYVMGRLLQFGVMLASLVVLTGGLLYIRAHHHVVPNYRIFAGERADLKSLHGVFSGISRMEPGAIIELGILLLIATPVARVVFAIAAFAIERDRLYVMVSIAVFAVLMGSLLLSR